MKRLIVFFAVLLLATGIAWIAGFDFDHRGPWVAFGVLVAFAFAAWAAAFPGLGEKP